MFRHSNTRAIVLHTHRIGEFHKGVTLLTREMGILTAIAHGAKKPKSRLSSATEPFCVSRVYLYHDPVKGGYKIKDMAIQCIFERLRESLVLYYTASLWTEVILRSYGGGDSTPSVFELLIACLQLLEKHREEKVPYVSVQFLWRFLHLSGFSPDLDTCDMCGRHLGPEETAFLSPRSVGFNCERCSENGTYRLNPGSRRFLAATSGRRLEEAMRFSLSEGSLPELKSVLYEIVQRVLEFRLNSLVCGQGIL